MKIIAFTPVWGRHKILNIWYEGIRRLKNKCNITPFCMVSTNEDAEWAESRGIGYIDVVNDPLGRKQNAGLEALRYTEFDYICQISSDLLLTDKGLKMMLPYMEQGYPLIGFDGAYFVNGFDMEVVEFKIDTESHKMIGACRMVSHKVISKLDYKLWDNHLNRNLDRSSEARVLGVDDRYIAINFSGAVGIKSDVQITPYGSIKRRATVVDVDLRDMVGDAEFKLISEL